MSPAAHYSLGLDFGTGSVRALLADISSGREAGIGAASFACGEGGIISDPRDPNLARQHPGDYAASLEAAVKAALDAARSDPEFSSGRVIGIGVDATASTPLPVDSRFRPLAEDERFASEPAALAWLWKDHTAHEEALEITEAARRDHPEYLARCGGSYSSEWYFSKLLRCLRVAPRVIDAAAGWIEAGDYITGLLTGASSPLDAKWNTCAAGHKAMYHPSRGYPSPEFLAGVDGRLGAWCRGRLPEKTYPAGTPAGGLSPPWASRLGLRPGTPVAVAAIDAHVGAVGAGIRPGILVRILGTSGCDMLVHPEEEPLPDIPGISGIASGSILPGHHGLEAGQAAVGDLLAWFVREIAAPAGVSHEALTSEAARIRPGGSGLLALDWQNGNRNILADPRLTGLVVGLTLHTRPAEVYRALMEASSFGARAIVERFEEYGVRAKEVIACGGIAEKNPLFLQIQSDVLGRPIRVSRSSETCALGAAIFGAVAAGRRTPGSDAEGFGLATVEEAQRAMTGLKPSIHAPDSTSREVYDELYRLYRLLHDAFGIEGNAAVLHPVMKRLLEVRERARGMHRA